MKDIQVTISEKKSGSFNVRGIATIDGISHPFTVTRCGPLWYDNTLSEADFANMKYLRLSSKNKTIHKFKDKDRIIGTIKDRARDWWIDNRLRF